MSVTVRGQKALIANLYAFSHRTREQFRVVTRKNGQAIRDRTAQLAAKDTGYMARNTKVKYSPDELVFEVGWWEEDFTPNDLPFYPPYVEGGTSRQPAQPALGPAYEWGRQQYEYELREAMRYSMRRGGR